MHMTRMRLSEAVPWISAPRYPRVLIDTLCRSSGRGRSTTFWPGAKTPGMRSNTSSIAVPTLSTVTLPVSLRATSAAKTDTKTRDTHVTQWNVSNRHRRSVVTDPPKSARSRCLSLCTSSPARSVKLRGAGSGWGCRASWRGTCGGEAFELLSHSRRDHVVCGGCVVPIPGDEELVAVHTVFRGKTRQEVD